MRAAVAKEAAIVYARKKMIKSDKKTQKRQEKEIAGMVGGKRQPFSGASERAKGDGISDDFLIEAKQTEKQSLSIKLKWLEKIDEEAMAVNKYPLLAIEFLNADPRASKDWIAVPKYVFQELFDSWKDK